MQACVLNTKYCYAPKDSSQPLAFVYMNEVNMW